MLLKNPISNQENMNQKNAQPIKYFLYARKSSESEDKQMASIESQIDELNKIAKENRLEIIEVFKESMSAKKPGRPIFSQMIEKIEKGEATGIICWKINRLARNAKDGGDISWMLQEEKIQHIQTYGRSYYPTDNVLMMAVELGMANQFIRDLSTDTKRGLRSKAKSGWCPYSPPLGYSHNPKIIKKGKKQVISDPEKFDLVKKAFQLVISNKNTPPEAFRIATTKWGLVNKRGGRIALSSWYYMLNNPFYYGEFEYPRGSGEWYKGKHKPMITQSDFLKVQALLGKKGTTRPQKYTFAYTGIMQCGQCGAMITAEHKVKRNKNGNTHFYTYYHCTKRKDPNCPEKVVEEKDLESQIGKFMKGINIPKGFKDWAINYLKKTYAQELVSEKRVCEGQEKALEATEQKLSRLLDMRLGNELTEAEFADKKAEIRKQKEDLKETINKAQEPSESWIDRLEKSLDIAEDIKEKFENGQESTKKQLLLNLGSNLTLINKIFTVQAENPILRIKKIASTSRAIYERFEPLETPINKRELELVYSSSPMMLPLVDVFRTVDWGSVESELQFSGILNLSPVL